MDLPGFTWIHLDSPGFTWIYLDLPRFFAIHLDFATPSTISCFPRGFLPCPIFFHIECWILFFGQIPGPNGPPTAPNGSPASNLRKDHGWPRKGARDAEMKPWELCERPVSFHPEGYRVAASKREKGACFFAFFALSCGHQLQCRPPPPSPR